MTKNNVPHLHVSGGTHLKHKNFSGSDVILALCAIAID